MQKQFTILQCDCLTRPGSTRCDSQLPADITADDHVASENGARTHPLIDGMRDDTGGHRELHWAGVHDADHVASSRGLEDAEERPVAAVLRVQLDDLIFAPEVG